MRRTTWRRSCSTRTCTSRRTRRSRLGSSPGAGHGTNGCASSSRRRSGVASAYGAEAQERVGFFTDTSVCIGCKACEVACKEWNLVPEDGLVWTGESYDNTSELGANTWRHVAFIEQNEPQRMDDGEKEDVLRWLMSSDVCKHCTHAACLDVCP